MIFYFSGTGNSQLAAELIAETVGDEIISINHYLKEGGQNSFRSERPLVFAAPTYAWRIPRVVDQWIRSTSFEGSRKAYFVLTCGGSIGNASAYVKKLCMEKKLDYYGIAQVLMPENYLAMYPTPEEGECRAIIEKARPVIEGIAVQIRNGVRLPESAVSFGDKLSSGPVNGLFYACMVRDKGFTVSDACISCGKCAKRCPLNNIEMAGGKPVWKGNCTHCMACIGGCPVEAIEYKSKSQGQHRHYIMKEG